MELTFTVTLCTYRHRSLRPVPMKEQMSSTHEEIRHPPSATHTYTPSFKTESRPLFCCHGCGIVSVLILGIMVAFFFVGGTEEPSQADTCSSGHSWCLGGWISGSGILWRMIYRKGRPGKGPLQNSWSDLEVEGMSEKQRARTEWCP